MVESYISFDLETTGLNPKRDKIIEVGAIKVIEGKEVDYRNFFLNPGIKLPERITEITGITDEDVKGANTIGEELGGLLEFMEDFPILGQSVMFDYSFLKKACEDQKITLDKEGLDTLRLARIYLPNLKSKQLSSLCEYYDIPLKAHRACEDARATHFLYQKLCEEFYDEKTFAPQKLFYKIKRDTPITKRQEQYLNDLIKKHHLEVEYTVSRMFKSEASREIDRILSTFGRS
jgi:DNA polymerase-3 subunit alpha (Gram-positive type)